MKNIEEAIKNTFIDLLNTHTIDEIDVQLISESLKIKRQTFYYHYKNIYDLVASIILDDQVEVIKATNIEEIINNVLESYYKNAELYREILSSSARDILIDATYIYFSKSLVYYLEKTFNLSLDARKEISSFISHGISNILIDYLKNENYELEETKIKVKAFLNEETLKYIVEGYSKNN